MFGPIKDNYLRKLSPIKDNYLWPPSFCVFRSAGPHNLYPFIVCENKCQILQKLYVHIMIELKQNDTKQIDFLQMALVWLFLSGIFL